MGREGVRLRIAYLNSTYPLLTHTFIEREVRALRAKGVEVTTFSVRRPNADGELGAANASAARETHYLLDTPWRLLASAAAGAIASPLGALRALIAGQRLSPPGLVFRIKHLAYWCEAIRLVRVLRRMELAHVHVHMANNGAAVGVLAQVFDHRIRYSLSIHGPAEFFRVDSWRMAEKVEAAAFVRCISHLCRAQVMAWTDPRCWSRCHLVRCGVDAESLRPRPPRAPGPLRLLSVARLEPVKGQRVLLDACRLLAAKGIEFQLEIVGAGSERARLERRTRELGLAEQVRFAGPVAPEEVGGHLDAADIFVLASFMEGVPVVLMEAMAKQVPVVATRVGGVTELVDEGESGLLVDPGSAEALATALERLARDPEMGRQLGAAGRRRVIADYSVSRAGDGMIDLFRRYVGADTGTPTAS